MKDVQLTQPAGQSLNWRRAPRRRYDPKFKQALVEQALAPGVSVAAVAREHGINANLLRIWIEKDRQPQSAEHADARAETAVTSPFVRVRAAAAACEPSKVASIHVRLPNGVELELRDLDSETLAASIAALHRLPCSASTTV